MGREIDMDDLLGIRVDNGDEVKGMCIYVFVFLKARKQETLLKAKFFREALIVTQRPSVGVDLVRSNPYTKKIAGRYGQCGLSMHLTHRRLQQVSERARRRGLFPLSKEVHVY